MEELFTGSSFFCSIVSNEEERPFLPQIEMTIKPFPGKGVRYHLISTKRIPRPDFQPKIRSGRGVLFLFSNIRNTFHTISPVMCNIAILLQKEMVESWKVALLVV